ncbi:MAG: phosphodiester glycosidase family protein [Actinomycetota bacterium]
MRRSTAYVLMALAALVIAVTAFAGGKSTTKTTAGGTTTVAHEVSTTTESSRGAATSTATGPSTTAGPSTTDTTTTTIADTSGYAPAPLTGLPRASESGWTPQVHVGGATVVWSATFHPLASAPDVKVVAAVIDQNRLTGALYNGFQLPGGGPWKNGDHVDTAARPALVLAFNGGFLFKHITGGYYTEGRTVKPLQNGQATLGVRKDGRLVLGIYGKDMTNDGNWLSIRQNLPPIVENGQRSLAKYPGTYWGNNFHSVDLDYRSAVCNRADGKLMYVVMGMVRIGTLADEMAALGCSTAMELDINGHWPQFAWYTGFGTTNRQGVLLDSRMWKPFRYVTTSEKDFIALFDPATLPKGAVYGSP